MRHLQAWAKFRAKHFFLEPGVPLVLMARCALSADEESCADQKDGVYTYAVATAGEDRPVHFETKMILCFDQCPDHSHIGS